MWQILWLALNACVLYLDPESLFIISIYKHDIMLKITIFSFVRHFELLKEKVESVL